MNKKYQKRVYKSPPPAPPISNRTKPIISIQSSYKFIKTHMGELYAIDTIKGVTGIEVKTEGVIKKHITANFSMLFKDSSETLYEFESESSAIKAKEFIQNQLLGDN